MNEILEILPDYTPDYVIDEVKYYFDKISQNKVDLLTLDNAISLVNLAKISHRITDEQAEKIKAKIRKIKN